MGWARGANTEIQIHQIQILSSGCHHQMHQLVHELQTRAHMSGCMCVLED